MGHLSGFRGLRLASAGALAAACTVLLPAAPAGATGAANTFMVSGFGDGTGSCTYNPDGSAVCPTLRSAVVAADKQSNDPTIELQAGTFQLTPGNGGQLVLGTANVVGVGPGGPSGTTIQQTDPQNRVLEVDGTSKLSGLEITGGSLAPAWSSTQIAYGGGILVVGALVLQDTLITGNQAVGAAGPSTGDKGDGAQGGGIDYASSALPGSVISDSTVTGNSAVGGASYTSGGAGGEADGGGISYAGMGPLVIQNSTISQNKATGGDGGPAAGGGGAGGAGNGGGIYNAGDLTLEADTIAANAATGGTQGVPASPSAGGGPGWGGGIFSQEAVDNIVNSTVFGNSAQGGAAAANGTPGNAYGGGILDEGSSAAATLQNDTVDANQSSFADGNLDINVGTAAPYPFTVHDTILAGGSPTNCGIVTPPSSESNNLEDDATGTCGFGAANHDLIGANPQLPNALADNGGLTQTLAPAPGSPAVGAGGECLDPTSTPPNQPLSVDQRGRPRPATCDIGAFQGQPPTNTLRPTISGLPARGQTLLCSEGTWSGDGPFVLAFLWLRNGVPIPGATTNTYVVAPADAGQSLACQVTATRYGSVATTTSFVVVRSYPVITLLKVSTSTGLVLISLGCRGPDGDRCQGLLELTSMERLRGHKVIGVSAAARRTITAGRHTYSIPARHTATLRIRLTRTALKLLARFKTLPATLTITQTTAAGTATVASRWVRLRSAHARRALAAG